MYSDILFPYVVKIYKHNRRLQIAYNLYTEDKQTSCRLPIQHKDAAIYGLLNTSSTACKHAVIFHDHIYKVSLYINIFQD